MPKKGSRVRVGNALARIIRAGSRLVSDQYSPLEDDGTMNRLETNTEVAV